MHDEKALPLPSLEQGILSLNQLSLGFSLPQDQPPMLLWPVILSAAARQSADMCLRALEEENDPGRRQDLALLGRAEESQYAALTALESSQSQIHRRIFLALDACVELSALLCQRLSPGSARNMLSFLTPEWLDMRYRFANLCALAGQRDPVSGYGEIMPGRPMIACHRHPYDGVLPPLEQPDFAQDAALLAVKAMIQSAREKIGVFAGSGENGLARGVLLEIQMVLSQHAYTLSSLLPRRSALATLLAMEETERFLFRSCAAQATAAGLRQYAMDQAEHAHARIEKLCALTEQSPRGDRFPPLTLFPSKGFIRETLEQVGATLLRDTIVPVGVLPPGADFFRYQQHICPDPAASPSHQVVEEVIRRAGQDYRYEIAPHPVEALRRRDQDNITVGR